MLDAIYYPIPCLDIDQKYYGNDDQCCQPYENFDQKFFEPNCADDGQRVACHRIGGNNDNGYGRSLVEADCYCPCRDNLDYTPGGVKAGLFATQSSSKIIYTSSTVSHDAVADNDSDNDVDGGDTYNVHVDFRGSCSPDFSEHNTAGRDQTNDNDTSDVKGNDVANDRGGRAEPKGEPKGPGDSRF